MQYGCQFLLLAHTPYKGHPLMTLTINTVKSPFNPTSREPTSRASRNKQQHHDGQRVCFVSLPDKESAWLLSQLSVSILYAEGSMGKIRKTRKSLAVSSPISSGGMKMRIAWYIILDAIFFFLNTHYMHSDPYVGTWHAPSNRRGIQGGGQLVVRPQPR